MTEKSSTNMLIIGTWVIAVSTVISVWLTSSNMADQTAQFERATELQWRPYLTLEQRDMTFNMELFLAETAESDSGTFRKLEEVAMHSTEFMAVKKVKYGFPRSALYRNIGATPMRITATVFSVLTETEWLETYEKDPNQFVKDLQQWKFDFKAETDLVILAGDSMPSPLQGQVQRFMSKSEFVELEEEDDPLIAYPYAYIEYDDFLGNSYNTLQMFHEFIPIGIVDDFAEFPDSGRGGLELYRWDVSTSD